MFDSLTGPLEMPDTASIVGPQRNIGSSQEGRGTSWEVRRPWLLLGYLQERGEAVWGK